MGSFFFAIIEGILVLLIWAIIISAVLSWLVAFNVINLRNQFVYNVVRMLEAVTAPVLAPFRRFIPPLGGVDISPIIAMVVLIAFRAALLPMIFRPIIFALG